MGVVRTGKVTDAILALARSTDIAVGDGVKERGAEAAGWQGVPGQSSFVGYAVLHSIEGGRTYGPIAEPNNDADQLYQVTGVGSTRQQAEQVADDLREALEGQYPQIADAREVMLITVDFLGGARRDDTVSPAVWITTDRFRVMTTPATTGS